MKIVIVYPPLSLNINCSLTNTLQNITVKYYMKAIHTGLEQLEGE